MFKILVLHNFPETSLHHYISATSEIESTLFVPFLVLERNSGQQCGLTSPMP